MTSSTPGCSTDAWPLRRPIPIPNGRNGLSGRSSRKSGRSSFPSVAGSTASTPCRPRCRRPAWCASTTTNTRSSASAVGRPVEIHAYADRIVIRQDGRIVAEHAALIRSRQDRLRSLALRAGAGAQAGGAAQRCAVQGLGLADGALERIRRKLTGSDDGDRQMVKILAAVLTDGLPEVEAACAQALSEGVHSADVVLNILARRRDPGPAATIMTPANLRLVHTPVADCARYDALRSA